MPTGAVGNWDEYDVTVTVTDGRLTIKPGAGCRESWRQRQDLFRRHHARGAGVVAPTPGGDGVVKP